MKKVIATANASQFSFEKPYNVSLAFYTAASCFENSQLKGAYSVVFRGRATGPTDDSELHQMGWNQPWASDREAAIKLAIAQALSIAEARLRTFANGPHGAGLNRARVVIFTNSRIALHHLVKDRIGGPRRALHTRIRSLVLKELEKLGEIPRMLVEVDFYWLPGDSGVYNMREAQEVAAECRKEGQSIYYVDDEDTPRSNQHLPRSISLQVRDVLILERLRLNKERREKGISTVGARAPRVPSAATLPNQPATTEQSPGPSINHPKTPSPGHNHANNQLSNYPVSVSPDIITSGGEHAVKDVHTSLTDQEAQELVDRQLRIETLEHNILFFQENGLPGHSAQRTQERYEKMAKRCAQELLELVPKWLES